MRLRWPEVDITCAPQHESLDDYIAGIGDVDRVVSMLVGDTQRLWVYPERGWAIEQPVPDSVRSAYAQLVAAGFTSRVLDNAT